MRKFRARRKAAAAALLSIIVGSTHVAWGETPATTFVDVSYARYEGMEQTYARWLRRAVTPHYPQLDPVTLRLDQRNLGPAAAVREVQNGHAQLAIVDQFAASEAWLARNRDGTAPGRRLRALFAAYRSALVFVTLVRRANAGPGTGAPQDVQTLRNQEIVFWPPPEGDPSNTTLAGVAMRALKLPLKSGRKMTALNSALYDMLYESRPRTLALSDGLPLRNLERFTIDNTPTIFGLGKATDDVKRTLPPLDYYDVAPGGIGYRGPINTEPPGTRVPLNMETIRTVGVWHFVLVRDDMAPCVAFRIVAAAMAAATEAGNAVVSLPDEPGEGFQANYVNLGDTKPGNVARIQDVPLHAGAALWLQANNVKLPASPRPDPPTGNCE